MRERSLDRIQKTLDTMQTVFGCLTLFCLTSSFVLAVASLAYRLYAASNL